MALHSHKAESVASVTSQCSFSSTIVHVGDKKPLESDIVMEDPPSTPTPATPVAIIAPPPPPPRLTSPASRRGGLTKAVLSAHTQQEEQAFLCRFSDRSQLRVSDPASALQCPIPTKNPLATGAGCSRDYPVAGDSRRRGRGAKKLKQSSEQRDPLALGMTVTLRGPNFGPMNSTPISTYPLPLGTPTTTTTTLSSWPASLGSQASLASVPYPPGMLPIDPPLSQPMGIPSMQNQMVPPMMALVVPNCIFPQLNLNMTQMATAMGIPMGSPMSQPGATMVTPSFNPNAGFPIPGTNGMPCPMPTMPSLMKTAIPIQAQRAASGSCTPQSCSQVPVEHESADFHSRCSSPLNLLQLVEELPSNRQEVATALATAAQKATPLAQASQERLADNSNENSNDPNQDAESTSSDLLDLLLQEDSRSGTGSAASGSRSSGSGSSGSGSGSLGSNGCSSSGSGTSRSQSHTSKYFGSIDSSENDHSGKQPAAGGSGAVGHGEEQFIKCVLQDPIWLLMANTDDKVTMTYQLPTKDREMVLREDREALKAMHKHQPRFTEDQKRDLSQVHPWIRTGRLPRALNISACMGCKSPPSIVPAAPFDVEIHEMELCSVLETTEKASTASQEKPTCP